MNKSVFEYADAADKAGAVYYDSVLLVCSDTGINEEFVKRIPNTTVCETLDEVWSFDGSRSYDGERWDKVVVIGSDSVDKDGVKRLANRARQVLAICGLVGEQKELSQFAGECRVNPVVWTNANEYFVTCSAALHCPSWEKSKDKSTRRSDFILEITRTSTP